MLENLSPLLTVTMAEAGAAAPAAEVASVGVESVWDFVLKGGIMMIPIGLCSLVAMTVVFDRLMNLRRRRIVPPALLDELTDDLEGSSDTAAALERCERSGSPLAKVLGVALRRLAAPRDLLERHVQECAEREIAGMRKYLRVLAVIASVAPLLGLLGTIFGMIEAFQTVAVSADALGKTEMLAKGIYQAMITTAAGLCVAIPALVLYHWMVSIVQSRVIEIDHIVIEFLDRHGAPIAPASPDTPALKYHDSVNR